MVYGLWSKNKIWSMVYAPWSIMVYGLWYIMVYGLRSIGPEALPDKALTAVGRGTEGGEPAPLSVGARTPAPGDSD